MIPAPAMETFHAFTSSQLAETSHPCRALYEFRIHRIREQNEMVFDATKRGWLRVAFCVAAV